MRKCRILFEKKGKAIYISHLDLMRTMQRIFVRTGVSIKHTEGFNPHPHMVFALPLSVGASSSCELLDVELEDDSEDIGNLPNRLNEKSPEGIEFVTAYVPETKFKDICYLDVVGYFEYDRGADEKLVSAISAFFSKDQIVIKKKTKKGIGDVDIKPGIKRISFTLESESLIKVTATVTAQNPTTNPDLIYSALMQKAPELAPDFSSFCRTSVLDKDFAEFK